MDRGDLRAIAAARPLDRLAACLAGADYNRFPTSTAAAVSFKQWVHVAVVDPAIALVANFSAMRAPDGSTAHRLVALVESSAAPAGPGLRGCVRGFPAEHCAMPAGRTLLRMGASELTTAGD
ncbi:MAG: hypothetical protein E6J90_36760, partial [Deltaproteobacteria bacterium]